MTSFRWLALCSLLISTSTFAVQMYYPGDTDGITAVEQAAQPPVYYPAQKTDPSNPNPYLPLAPNNNSNIQNNVQMPSPTTE